MWYATIAVSEVQAVISDLIGLYDMGIKYSPDLMFIEFAVNDYWTMEGTRNTMEAIVRGLQTMENPPYIVFVYTAQYNASNTDDISNSTKAAQWQQEVADYYGIPSINFSEDVYKLYVAKRVSEGVDQLTAIQEFLSSDKVHPMANGHKLYGEYIVEKLKTGDYYKKAAVRDEWYLDYPKYDYVPKLVQIADDMITGTYSMSHEVCQGSW